MSRPLRILFSYHYYKNEDIAQLLHDDFAGIDCDVFFDSGAYSAWTTGSTITVDEYVAWLKKWGHLCSCAAALDVIGDAKASYEQTEELRAKLGEVSFPIIPVYHSNDEGGFVWLDRYLKAGYDYIGISPTGSIYRDKKAYRAWLAECFRRRPAHVRYHGFGVTHLQFLKEFPWYSVDSTTWMTGFFFAELRLFDSNRGQLVNVRTRDRKSILQNSKLLDEYKLSARDVRADNYNRPRVVAASVRSWQRIEDFMNQKRIYLGSSINDNKAIAESSRIYLGTLPGGESMQSSPKSIGKALRDIEPRIYLGTLPGSDATPNSPGSIGIALKGV